MVMARLASPSMRRVTRHCRDGWRTQDPSCLAEATRPLWLSGHAGGCGAVSAAHLIRVTRDSDTAYSQETLVVSTLCRSSVRKGGHQANANPCRWPKWLPR